MQHNRKVLREKNDIERLVELFNDSALSLDGPSRIIWEHFLSFYKETGEPTLDPGRVQRSESATSVAATPRRRASGATASRWR